jgi:hypothetical protein
MNEPLRQGQATDLWQQLVQESGARVGAELDEELESYLVFLLMRHMRDAPLLGRVMALEYLEAMELVGQRRLDEQRDVGDRCLIVAGLFPEQARRRRVDDSYFIVLGQGAYYAVAEQARAAYAALFRRLAEAYEALVRVLTGVRGVAGLALPDGGHEGLVVRVAPAARSARSH